MKCKNWKKVLLIVGIVFAALILCAIIGLSLFVGKLAADSTLEGKGSSVAILVHGAGGDRVSVVPLAELYLENGWSVLMFDQRGSGDNSDDKVCMRLRSMQMKT